MMLAIYSVDYLLTDTAEIQIIVIWIEGRGYCDRIFKKVEPEKRGRSNTSVVTGRRKKKACNGNEEGGVRRCLHTGEEKSIQICF